MTLASELSNLVDSDRRPLANVPQADFSIVIFWPEICKPCKQKTQAEANALREILAFYKSKTINIFNVLNIETDLRKK